MNLFLLLLAVAALVVLNAFFVAAEYGLVTVRRTRIRELSEKGNRSARAVRRIISEPPRFIAAMQLGVTLTSLAIGALGEPVLRRAFDPAMATLLAIILAFLIITFFHVVFGELVPKGVALSYSERTALAVSTPVRGFFILFWPLIWVLQHTTEAVLRSLKMEPPGAEGEVHSEAELKMLLDRSQEHGEIEPEEQEMVTKIFDFADKEVDEVMVPRPEVVAISIDLPPEESLAAMMESPYTRYPVYRGSLDEIVGVLHVRDLFSALMDQGIAGVDVEKIVRAPFVVPETKSLGELLTEFRSTNQHLAIVVDEYGAMQGIATLEDLLEEIVGEIEDEFDLPDDSIVQVGDRRWRIQGTLTLDEFNERFGTKLESEDFHTMEGFVFGELGRAPEPGDEVEYEGMSFRVEEVEGSRILLLTVTLPGPAEEAARARHVAEG